MFDSLEVKVLFTSWATTPRTPISAPIYLRAAPSSYNPPLRPFLFFVTDFHPRKSRFSVALPVVKKSF